MPACDMYLIHNDDLFEDVQVVNIIHEWEERVGKNCYSGGKPLT